jgi:hypothetical protein
MSDPSLPMQAAIVARLKANGAVSAIVEGRVFDAVPTRAAKPYVNLGQPQVIPDKATCVDGAEVSYPVHGWAEGPQSVEIKQLGAAVVAALDEIELTVTGHRLVVFELEQLQYLDDPDGITKHFVAVFRALTEPE